MSENKQFEVTVRVTVDRIVTVEAESRDAAANWLDCKILEELDVDMIDWSVRSVREV